MSESFVTALSSKSTTNVIQMLMTQDVSDHEGKERREQAN